MPNLIYSPANLEMQIKHHQHKIEVENSRLAYVKSPEFHLAKEYGEDIRANHIRTIEQRIEWTQKLIEQAQANLDRIKAA